MGRRKIELFAPHRPSLRDAFRSGEWYWTRDRAGIGSEQIFDVLEARHKNARQSGRSWSVHSSERG